jgi:uncharacterized protein
MLTEPTPSRAGLSRRPPLLSRRRFLTASAALLATTTATYAHATTIAPHNLTLENLTIPIPNLAPSRHGTRLALLSDLHAGPRVSFAHIQRALRMAADLQPDYLLIPGDFVDSTLSHLEPLCQLLAPIAARIPTYGSTGNHDFARDFRTLRFANTVCEALQSAGVRMLRNAFHQPTPGPGELCFAGLEDLWSGHLDPAPLTGAPADASIILLSHNPDSYESAAHLRFHLMLSGHTHGGQVCIPGIGPLILPIQHRDRAAGLLHLNPTQPHQALYVTRGIGHLRKIRFFCPPEITLITLESA